MSNNVAFQITIKKDTFEGTVASDVATKKKTTISDVVEVYEDSDPSNCEDSDSVNSNEDEPSIEDIQKAYREMYDNWIKVCNVNKSFKDKLFELTDENAELKSASANWKNLLKEKDEKVQEIKAELENT